MLRKAGPTQDFYLFVFNIPAFNGIMLSMTFGMARDLSGRCNYVSPVETGCKLNLHETFRRRPGRLLNVLCTFNLRPVSTGIDYVSYGPPVGNHVITCGPILAYIIFLIIFFEVVNQNCHDIELITCCTQ